MTQALSLQSPRGGGRRVRHKRFGAGTVTEELESGTKLVVRFDSGVQKQLLARFVSDE